MSVSEGIPSHLPDAGASLRASGTPDASSQPRGKQSSRPSQTSINLKCAQVHFQASKNSSTGTGNTFHQVQGAEYGFSSPYGG